MGATVLREGKWHGGTDVVTINSAAGVKAYAVETNGTVRVALTVPVKRDVKWRVVFGSNGQDARWPSRSAVPGKLTRAIPRECQAQDLGPVPPGQSAVFCVASQSDTPPTVSQ